MVLGSERAPLDAEARKQKRNWLQPATYLIIILLTAEVILLIIQNRELKKTLNTMSVVAQIEPINPGERVEPFKLQTLDGNVSELVYTDPTKQYLLFVLSTTCPHCEKTLVNWQAITAHIRDSNCTIIGISIHNLDETKKYIATKNVSFYIGSAFDTSFSRKYKISGVPETILIRGDGIVQKTWLGELTTEQTTEIQNLVTAPSVLSN